MEVAPAVTGTIFVVTQIYSTRRQFRRDNIGLAGLLHMQQVPTTTTGDIAQYLVAAEQLYGEQPHHLDLQQSKKTRNVQYIVGATW